VRAHQLTVKGLGLFGAVLFTWAFMLQPVINGPHIRNLLKKNDDITKGKKPTLPLSTMVKVANRKIMVKV